MSEKHHKYAFPGADPWEEVEPGMTLRDYFASKALQGYIAFMGCDPDKVDPIGKNEGEPNKTVIARCAYTMADAMIAERGKERKVNRTVKREGWVNVYTDTPQNSLFLGRTSPIYKSKEQADIYRETNGKIGIRIEWEEESHE